MYLLYAPKNKFGVIPNGHPLIFNQVVFRNNFACSHTQYHTKIHTALGVNDITPNYLKKIRQKRELGLICVFATGGIGDSMWSMPICLALRKKYPNAKIYAIAEKRTAEIWKCCQYITDTLIIGTWNAMAMLDKADEIYDFGGIATTNKKYIDKDPIEAAFEIAELDKPTEKKDLRPVLTLTAEEGHDAQQILKIATVDVTKDDFVCIGLEPSTANRVWPLTYVKELTEALKTQNIKVVWLGESKEWQAEFIKDEFKKVPDGNLVGKTSLRQAAAIIALADCYVGPNSSLMMIATSLGIPTVGLFGAFAPSDRAKNYERFDAAYVRQACAPCREHWTECRHGHPAPCMKSIMPKMVYEKTLALMRKYKRPVISKLPIE